MTSRRANNTTDGRNGPTCPHCGSGGNRRAVVIFWESYEECWRCVICGYRGYPESLKETA